MLTEFELDLHCVKLHYCIKISCMATERQTDCHRIHVELFPGCFGISKFIEYAANSIDNTISFLS